jgi:hypothetical protein
MKSQISFPISFLCVGISTLVLPSCGQRAAISKQTLIIGENNLTEVDARGSVLPPKLRPLINAFGMLDIGCTVTHIGNHIAITAGHCVPKSVKVGAEAPCWPNATIQWGYRIGVRNMPFSHCVRVLAAEFDLFKKDYAILRVDNAPKEKIEVEPNIQPKLGAGITMFGHPNKRTLEWSKYCVVGAPPKDYQSGEYFGHQCDSEPGNSGSVIIDVKTLRVVGIHNGGEFPTNYATFTTNSSFSQELLALGAIVANGTDVSQEPADAETPDALLVSQP